MNVSLKKRTVFITILMFVFGRSLSCFDLYKANVFANNLFYTTTYRGSEVEATYQIYDSPSGETKVVAIRVIGVHDSFFINKNSYAYQVDFVTTVISILQNPTLKDQKFINIAGRNILVQWSPCVIVDEVASVCDQTLVAASFSENAVVVKSNDDSAVVIVGALIVLAFGAIIVHSVMYPSPYPYDYYDDWRSRRPGWFISDNDVKRPFVFCRPPSSLYGNSFRPSDGKEEGCKSFYWRF